MIKAMTKTVKFSADSNNDSYKDHHKLTQMSHNFCRWSSELSTTATAVYANAMTFTQISLQRWSQQKFDLLVRSTNKMQTQIQKKANKNTRKNDKHKDSYKDSHSSMTKTYIFWPGHLSSAVYACRQRWRFGQGSTNANIYK